MLELPKKSTQPLSWGAFDGCADALTIANAGLESEQLLLIICSDTQSALRLEREIPFFLTKELPVIYFPDWEVLPYDSFSPLGEIISERLATLYHLQQLNRGILIVTTACLLQRLAPRQLDGGAAPSAQCKPTRFRSSRLGHFIGRSLCGTGECACGTAGPSVSVV